MVTAAMENEVNAAEPDKAPQPDLIADKGHPPPPPTDVQAPAGEQPDESPKPPVEETPVEDKKKWYVVKVQSGREESIKDAIERKVKIEGLQEYFGQIFIPTEKVTEMKKGKRVVKERKLLAGYLMVNVEFNDRILYLFRETSGVGDFVGGGLNKPPMPMSDKEVQRMIGTPGGEKDIKEKITFEKGEKVKVKDGTFAGMEGEIKDILEAKGAVRVELTIFGRPVPVELEYWQVDYV
jgi:transcriptional antiterminator NusG